MKKETAMFLLNIVNGLNIPAKGTTDDIRTLCSQVVDAKTELEQILSMRDEKETKKDENNNDNK